MNCLAGANQFLPLPALDPRLGSCLLYGRGASLFGMKLVAVSAPDLFGPAFFQQ